MIKLQSFLRNNWLLILIILVGLFFRVYKPLELYNYGHDQDLAGWMVKDILVNHHLRLIGQETSSQGVFIGPLFYYLQIPFYLLTKMNPVGTLLLPLILSIFSIFSFYFVFSKIFNKRTGLITALIYAVSAVIVFTDRESVPTMPVVLWTVWYFYSLWLLMNGKQKSYILIGFLFGLVWHLSLALAVVSPLVVLVQIYSKKKLNIGHLAFGIGLFAILMSPFFVFEARHNFMQTKAIFASISTQKGYVPGTARGLGKLDRVMQLVHTNTVNLYGVDRLGGSWAITFYVLVAIFIFLIYKKIIPWKLAAASILWQILIVSFFTLNAINVSEYYLNGMNIIWIMIGARGINYLLGKEKTEYVAYILVGFFILFNFQMVLATKTNGNGYLQRTAVVEFIKQDAAAHGYPCVSVSYITSPGNNLGYRYLFWLQNMHVNNPISKSPVYSIVFPLSLVSGVDKTFGALGLVLPDYKKYTKSGIDKSCSGENSNLTDPMFGYTE